MSLPPLREVKLSPQDETAAWWWLAGCMQRERVLCAGLRCLALILMEFIYLDLFPPAEVGKTLKQEAFSGEAGCQEPG